MSQQPSVSVVIPVLNGEKYLPGAFECILAQSLPAYEIIVVDDGSTDRTPAIIEEYKKKAPVRSLRIDPNKGIANAMSEGTKLATGKYVAYLDHDDVWFRDKLKKQVELLERYPEAVLACCNFIQRPIGGSHRVRHYSKLKFMKHFDPTQPIIRDPHKVLIGENIMGTSSTVVLTKAVADKVGDFNRSYRISGDYDYWMRCSLEGAFVVSDEVLMYKRTHVTNISANTIRTWDEFREILRLFPAKLKEKGLFSAALAVRCRQEASQLGYTLAELSFAKKEPEQGFKYYREALNEDKTPLNTLRFAAKTLKKRIKCGC